MTFRESFDIDLIQSMGSDEMVARAARVSTGRDTLSQGKIEGLIGYLAREHHTSPFESCAATFRISAPIFAARQIMRHRTFSYSELSLRYTESGLEFYMPGVARPRVNNGSSAHPDITQTDEVPHWMVTAATETAYRAAAEAYTEQIKNGVAQEVARNVLPLATYTSFYMTGNLHNWVKFIRLRNGSAGHPQFELVEISREIEHQLTDVFPISMKAWKNAE